MVFHIACVTMESRNYYPLIKRLFDFVLSLLGIVLIAPLLAFVSVLVKLSSPGPVIYRGLRTGKDGETFEILKFRTMVVGADKGAGTTSRNDSRVTSVGRFLRRYKIDELPQLINVLRGQMSFVGPRPELPRYTDLYEGKETLILTVRPGITDFSSLYFIELGNLISDSDPDSDFENKVLKKKNLLRIRYVEEKGFLTDVRILFKTFLYLTGVSRRGL